MEYLFNDCSFKFDSPVKAIQFATDNGKTSVKLNAEEEPEHQLKYKDKFIDISDSLLNLLFTMPNANWIVISSSLPYYSLLT